MRRSRPRLTRQAEIAQQRAQHDRFLLATYLSTKDIEQLRDERTALVEAQIKAAQAYIETLNSRLDALKERALRFKPYSSEANARRMPDDLAEELVHALNEWRTQRLSLESKRHEETDMRGAVQQPISALPRADLPSTAAAALAHRPLWPKPPAPRALAVNSSTTSSATCTTGTTISCAIRSPGRNLVGRAGRDSSRTPSVAPGNPSR